MNKISLFLNNAPLIGTTSETDANGRTIYYEYDGFDRVTSMKYYTNSNREKVLESYEYKYDRNSNITYKHEKTGYDNSLLNNVIS